MFSDTPLFAEPTFQSGDAFEFDTLLAGVRSDGTYQTWAGLGTDFLWKSNASSSTVDNNIFYLSNPFPTPYPSEVSGGVYGIDLDISGNVSTDTTPPTTTSWVSGTAGTNGWYTGPVTVTIAATDVMPGSGIASTSYRIDDGGWLPYVSPFTIGTDGVHNVEFYSTDNAGNVEATRTLTIKVDQSPPVTTASLSGRLGNNGWYVGPVTVALAATDNLSGVAATRYRVPGGPWRAYTGPFTVSTNGVHTFEFSSTDNAGNVEATHRLTIDVESGSGGYTGTDQSVVILPQESRGVLAGSNGSGAVMATDVRALAPLPSIDLRSHAPTLPPTPRGPLILLRGFASVRRNSPAQSLPDKRSWRA
jgi:hypothetical protein